MRVPLAESWVVDLFCFLGFVVDLPNIRLTTGPQSTPQYWSRDVLPTQIQPTELLVLIPLLASSLRTPAAYGESIGTRQRASRFVPVTSTLRYLGAQRGIA